MIPAQFPQTPVAARGRTLRPADRAEWTYAHWHAFAAEEAARDVPTGNDYSRKAYAALWLETFAPIRLVRQRADERKLARDAGRPAPFRLGAHGLERLL